MDSLYLRLDPVQNCQTVLIYYSLYFVTLYWTKEIGFQYNIIEGWIDKNHILTQKHYHYLLLQMIKQCWFHNMDSDDLLQIHYSIYAEIDLSNQIPVHYMQRNYHNHMDNHMDNHTDNHMDNHNHCLYCLYFLYCQYH